MLNPSIWMSIQSEKEHCPTKGETNKSDDEGISFECRGSGNVVVVWAEYPTSAGLSWRWCDCTSAVDVGGCGGEIAGCWGSVGTHCVVARDGAIAGGAIARRLRCWREDLGGGENKSAGARADLSVGAKTDKGWKGGRRDDCLTDVLGRLLLLRLWTRQREEWRGTHLCSGQERKGKSNDEPSRPHDGRGQNVKEQWALFPLPMPSTLTTYKSHLSLPSAMSHESSITSVPHLPSSRSPITSSLSLYSSDTTS